MQINKTLVALGLAAALTTPAQAELLSGLDSFSSNLLVQDFSDAASYDTSVEQVQIGASLGVDLSVSALGGVLNVGAPFGAWSFGSNGEWNSEFNYLVVDGDWQDEPAGIAASLVFSFGTAVSEVGFFANYDPDYTYGGGLPLPLYIAAYDASGALLEDYFLPLFTSGGTNEGEYYGIRLDNADIAYFEVSGPYAGVADFRFSAPVPEPSEYAMLLAGLGLIGLALRRR